MSLLKRERYENPKIPEGINVSSEHPLKEFAALALAALGIVILAVIVLSFMAQQLAPYIPFEAEKRVAGAFAEQLKNTHDSGARQTEIQAYLQNLVNGLANRQALPSGMSITVHYVDDDVINAFATLGGHVVIYKGLLKEMPHENALSVVMAHEIAHIKHRDPIVSMGRGLTVLLALASIVGVNDSSLFERTLGQAGLLTALSFNRQQEKAADLEAYKTLTAYYGHLEGAEALFEALKQQEDNQKMPAFFRTHPLTGDRIEVAKGFAASVDSPKEAQLKALPGFIKALGNDFEESRKNR